MMLEEVLRTLSSSQSVGTVVVVSADRAVFDIARRFGADVVEDRETGVNDAVALADARLARGPCEASVVFPQDLPLMEPRDVDFLVRLARPPECAVVVPSRRFDGTNALLRAPPCLMGTHYDADSYRMHVGEARRRTPHARLAFVRRVMADVDVAADLEYCLRSGEKPDLCARIAALLGRGAPPRGPRAG